MHTDRTILSLCMMAAAAIIASSCPAISSAQGYTAPPVVKSKEKVNLSGKIYFSHIVKEKQTLFSIAKAYEVSIDDIMSANPKLKDSGLKKNDIILIPASTQTTVREEASAAEKPAVEETSVQEAAGKKVEPKAEEQKVEVKEDIEDSPKQEKGKKKQTIHKRKWYEDLDTIASKYNVSVESLMKANGLTGRKLTKGQKLIIPDEETFVEDAAEETAVPADTVSIDFQHIDEAMPEDQQELTFTPKNTVDMTLILPLRSKSENPSRNNIDFYSGVLTAVRNIANGGTSTELNVYDSSDPGTLVESEVIAGSDVIMGPVSTGDLKRLIPDIPEGTGLVSPLDPRAEALAYETPNFIQAPTPQSAQFNDLVEWIIEDRKEADKIFVISEKGTSESEAYIKMKGAIDSYEVPYIPFSYNILEGRDVVKPLTELMTAEGTNRVMIASESEAFVNDVVRNLNILIHQKLDIVLYAPAKIRTFETIEVENLHNTALHVSLGYYIDYDDVRVRKFLMEYRALFNAEPSQYAFQGYDLAAYFISLCAEYGDSWESKLDSTEKEMLQSTFRFSRTENGGFVNNGVRRIVYGKDWSITRIK